MKDLDFPSDYYYFFFALKKNIWFKTLGGREMAKKRMHSDKKLTPAVI